MRFPYYIPYFPTPRHLMMSTVGLDISDRSIKYAELSRRSGQLQVKRYGIETLSPGIIEDGEIKESNELIKVLKKMRKDLGNQFVRVAMPEEQAYLFSLTIKNVKKSEIRPALELQIEKHVPLSAADAVFDYAIIEPRGSGYTVQVAVLDRAVVSSYLDVLEAAGLVPLSFELEPQALSRSIINIDDRSTVMVVDMGHTHTGIAIVQDGVVMFSASIDIGGISFTKVVREHLDNTMAEAEKLKMEHGFRDNDVTKGYVEPMRALLKELAEGVSRYLVYWENQPKRARKTKSHIDYLLLCGGNANMPGIAELLVASLAYEVRIADVWSNIHQGEHLKNRVPEIPRAESLRFGTSLGLSLGDYIVLEND